MNVSPDNVAFIKLILRSPDTGDGWRKVSSRLWPFVESFKHQELIEMRDDQFVRLSGRGEILKDYL